MGWESVVVLSLLSLFRVGKILLFEDGKILLGGMLLFVWDDTFLVVFVGKRCLLFRAREILFLLLGAGKVLFGLGKNPF